MDFFLNFKNKKHDAQYHEDIDPYLSKVWKTLLVFWIAILPFYPYSEIVIMQTTTERGPEFIRAMFVSAIYGTMLVIPFIIYFKRPTLRRHQTITRWVLDLFFSLSGGYFAYFFWAYISPKTEPIFNYLLGWLQAFIMVALLSPISRWYLKAAAYLAIILRIGIGSCLLVGSPYLIIKVIQMVLIQIPVTYLSERDRRSYFIEKQSLYEETNVYKEIFDLASDGVVIYGLKEGLLFHNWASGKYRWRQAEQSLQQNFEQIQIKGFNKTADIPANIELDLDAVVKASDQANLWIFLEHLTRRLSQNLSSTHSPSSTGEDRVLKPGYLMQITGSVENHTFSDALNRSSNFLLEIKVMLTAFKENPSLVLVFSDITERSLVAVLQENNSYKDRLLASVSHELRTPLNASINFTQSAVEHPALAALPDVRDNYLLPALRSNQLLLHLINDILDFSQMSANKLRLIYENKNVSETLEECMSLVKIQASRKSLAITSEFVTEDGKNEFCTDHNRLKQIILNLLSNALKFTLEGEIKVKAKLSSLQNSSLEECDRIHMPEESKHRVLSVSITDTGIGISEENKRKLFKAFGKIELGDRTPINAQGVGLGLVISNNLVLLLGPPEQNNGMKVESVENQGTTFSFWIVDKTDETHSSDQQSSNEEIHSSEIEEHNDSQADRVETLSNLVPIKTMDTLNSDYKKPLITRETGSSQQLNPTDPRKYPRILVVDDDIFNISALQMILNKLGYTCDTAYNGQQAIDKVVEREQASRKIGGNKSIQYRLILMDYNMPIMNGLEATRILKNKIRDGELEEISIIACTAFLNDKEKLYASELGVDAYCYQPLNKDRVSTLVKKYVPYKV